MKYIANICNNCEKNEIENKSKIIYKELGASGVIRIDFLYKDKLYVNEINAIPGSYAYYLWDEKYDFLDHCFVIDKYNCTICGDRDITAYSHGRIYIYVLTVGKHIPASACGTAADPTPAAQCPPPPAPPDTTSPDSGSDRCSNAQ